MNEYEYKYILEGKNPVKCSNLNKWAQYMQTADRRVARTEEKDIVISTVFLGINMDMGSTNIPKLFETLIVGGEYDGDIYRCATWQEAENQHEIACKKSGVSYARS